jgi:hypothetical protein
MKVTSISKTAFATATMLAAAIAMAAGAGAADRIRFQCAASGAIDISMSARYDIIRTVTPNRRKFSTEFEAGPGTGFLAGSRLNVVVKGVKVGSMRLEAIVGGDVVGDLNFDTRRQLDALPFPANWPAGVGRGSRVNLLRAGTRVLGCTLG